MKIEKPEMRFFFKWNLLEKMEKIIEIFKLFLALEFKMHTYKTDLLSRLKIFLYNFSSTKNRIKLLIFFVQKYIKFTMIKRIQNNSNCNDWRQITLLKY